MSTGNSTTTQIGIDSVEGLKERAQALKAMEAKHSEEAHTSQEAVLERLDAFLHSLEQHLDQFEKYGLHKLSDIDREVVTMYQQFSSVRDSCQVQAGEMISRSRSRLDKFIEIGGDATKYAKDSLANRSHEYLHSMEEKLGEFENQVSDIIKKIDMQTEQFNETVRLAFQKYKTALLTIDDLPQDWKENPYILRGYRFCDTSLSCFASIMSLHNETCNIWTHLLGFLGILSIAVYFYPNSEIFAQSTGYDKAIIYMYLTCAMSCLGFSTLWHIYSGIGHIHIKRRAACLDYTGISIQISGSILATQYYAFYCQPVKQLCYMSCTAVLGVIGAYMTSSPTFDLSDNRIIRIAFFVGFALLGLVSVLHLSYERGLSLTMSFFWPVVKSNLWYLYGLVFYGLLIPERFFPGTVFDWIGMSHNFWHIAVFAGVYFGYEAFQQQMAQAEAYSCMI
ncbi:hypothetical protein CANCADRAFT_31593 [Tortispora caseinolytica NRRL Y-17796]|uniref:HlyIII-domain-containing protein n=1 Tax=Tortispora caseinolytica NRRL Y-17796 TaxID=767744 RepID=A0A1E4TG71_9ASCO|nr:hypothetical protein CANCADRAFT_31593 [Tortispora caseinolytica NRRL Y-17796]